MIIEILLSCAEVMKKEIHHKASNIKSYEALVVVLLLCFVVVDAVVVAAVVVVAAAAVVG